MRKVRFFLVLLGLCWFSGQNVFLYAQQDNEYEDDDEDYKEDILDESEWDSYLMDLYSRGDQTFTIALGVMFPLTFYNYEGKEIVHNINPPVGGAGSLGYTHFLNAHFFLGGEIGIKFAYTLGQNTVFLIPIGIKTGWQFIIQRFEIPLNLVVGMAPQRYLDHSYLGFFMRAGVSVYFRFSPEWSFGLDTGWNWYPQWPQKDGKWTPEKNIDANILGLTLAARYHF